MPVDNRMHVGRKNVFLFPFRNHASIHSNFLRRSSIKEVKEDRFLKMAAPHQVDEATQRCVKALAKVTADDIKRKRELRSRRRRRYRVKPCYARRDVLGAASTLLQEWAEDTPEEFENICV